MSSTHKIIFADSKRMKNVENESVQLVVTSPPYPMIEMWDDLFTNQNPEIKKELEFGSPHKAFELMHSELDQVWIECYRVLQDGGFICINIGDATRSFNKKFQLFPNHVRIIQKLSILGFQILPEILWRKQTNAPNKFMGSGMLPAGAYVTLEHEYILVARKGSKRQFLSLKEREMRQESAFFWEERNNWFSDIWDFKGASQRLHKENLREKSAAYPFELAYRLVNMYSTKYDTVLDPFVGTGTTILATIASERNSIGFEIDETFNEFLKTRIISSKDDLNQMINQRLHNHKIFVKQRQEDEKEVKHNNNNYNFPVVTKQEENIIIRTIREIKETKNNTYEVVYNQISINS